MLRQVMIGLFLSSMALSIHAATPAISAGYGHTLALHGDGTLAAWGDNAQGQLGQQELAYATSPLALAGVAGIVQISAGRQHNLAVKVDGTLLAWGSNFPYGQLGDGSASNQSSPIVVPTLDHVIQAAAGEHFSVALKADGSVWAWGRNHAGQLGNGETADRFTPLLVANVSHVKAIAAGGAHVLALHKDGRLQSWGDNHFGQLGIGTKVSTAQPSTVNLDMISLGLPIQAVAAGYAHSLALASDGSVWAWGSNQNGQLGIAQSATSPSIPSISSIPSIVSQPIRIPSLSNIVAIAAGREHSLALKSDGTVLAWGNNARGQLGDSSTQQRMIPTAIAEVSDVVAIAAGDSHSVILKSDGSVQAWGWNYIGQLGDETWGDNRLVPIAVAGDLNLGKTARNIEQTILAPALPLFLVGEAVALPLRASSGLPVSLVSKTPDICTVQDSLVTGLKTGHCQLLATQRGDAQYRAAPEWLQSVNISKGRQLIKFSDAPRAIAKRTASLSATSSADLPVVLNSLTPEICTIKDQTVTGVKAGTCTISADQIGDENYNTATQTSLSFNVTPAFETPPMVAVGQAHSLALKSDGTLMAWGDNTSGQLGLGHTKAQAKQVIVPDVQDIIAVASGFAHSLALKADGTVLAWGDNSKGQLGDGSTQNQSKPQLVVGLENVIAIAAGGWHNVVLKSDGSIMVWGLNNNGQLGNGNVQSQLKPFLIEGMSEVKSIAAGRDHSVVLKKDGSVWTWGNNSNGALGDGTTLSRFSPAKVAELLGVAAISAGLSYTMALKSDGTAAAWGKNDAGQLGDGSKLDKLKPVPIQGVADAVMLAAGEAYAMALKKDGGVFAWGNNALGQFGDGSNKSNPIPAVVGTVTGMLTLAAGSGHSVAISPEGIVLAWGNNSGGQLGNGNKKNTNVPKEASEAMNLDWWKKQITALLKLLLPVFN